MACGVQVIRKLSDLGSIEFDNGAAALEVKASLLPRIRFKNHKRGGGPRLDAVIRSIRDKGYQPMEPIIARIGRRGKWVVVDGGHRLTALRRLSGSLWSRLFGRDFGYVYFILFQGERSHELL